jgi:CheY-like chemotaxis protein
MMGGRLNPRKATIQLSEIISRVAIVIDSYSREVPICFHLESGIINYVITDEEWLWQMLLNYLTNACKYTESGTIDIEVKRWSKLADSDQERYPPKMNAAGGDFLLFQIIDSGIGISDQHASTLFNVFGQAQVGQATGTGMGLYGVKIRAESLDGDCGVLSRERHDGKQGSVFWFTIPYVADDQGFASDPSPDRHSKGSEIHLANSQHFTANLFKKIEKRGEVLRLLLLLKEPSQVEGNRNPLHAKSKLSYVVKTDTPLSSNCDSSICEYTAFVVDDVQMIRKLMQRTLKNLGFLEIELFENGSKALTAMKEKQVDIVFMDVQMPVMSGPEVSSIR